MRARRRRSTLLLALERALLVLGSISAGWYTWKVFEIRRHQEAAREAVERVVVEQPRAAAATPGPPAAGGRALGQIDVPRIGLSAIVVNTDDDDALGFAVAYLPDSPLPWKPGNSVLAAHRDGLFRPLRNIRAGDGIVLTTRLGRQQYRVRRTLVVGPRDVWVLGAVPHVDLTLVTCFPFSWVGHARERFIVQAEKVRGP